MSDEITKGQRIEWWINDRTGDLWEAYDIIVDGAKDVWKLPTIRFVTVAGGIAFAISATGTWLWGW